MDCVTCDKCRLNGKVQTRGLATALKVLFMPEENKSGYIEGLQNQELVSLVQLAAKLSESLEILDGFRDDEQQTERVCRKLCQATEIALALLIGLVTVQVARKLRRKEDRVSTHPRLPGKSD